jgi:Phage P22-like portal protein
MNQEELLKKIKKDRKKAIEADNHNHQEALEDLKFVNIRGSQWDDNEKQRRKRANRPCLEINGLPKFCNQVTGEMRRNKVKIKVRPVDSAADVKKSKIREGLIYNIEYLSNAESIYDHAGKMLVQCGYGAWRVLTRKNEDNPFLKEIYLTRIQNPFSIHFDPSAQDQNFEDANYSIVDTYLSEEDFKDLYPNAKFPVPPPNPSGLGIYDASWYEEKKALVVEYFYKVKENKKMVLLSDGRVMSKEEGEKIVFENQESINKLDDMQRKIVDLNSPKIVDEADSTFFKIKWCKATAEEILEEKDWPGKFIPLILVTGDEINIGGKKYISGLIRNAKDSQRMYNFWHTSISETIALSPKSPYLVTSKMIDKHENSFATSNEENHPFLIFNVDPELPGPPVRQSPPTIPQAMFAEVSRAEENIKSSIGMYDADIGDRGRELSGRAIMARQVPGDTATFVYPDNMARAIAYSGKIINDLIPKIYDTERDVRLRNFNDTESFMPINAMPKNVLNLMEKNPNHYSEVEKSDVIEADKNGTLFNDISVGKYDIVITTGPTYQTQRMEAAEKLVQLAAYISKLSPLDKYYILKNQDIPDADEYADAVRKMIPPNILPPKAEEKPLPQQQPTPQMQAMMLKMQVEQEKMKTEKARQQVALAKLYKESKETETEIRKEIISILQELHAPFHPADNLLQNFEGGFENA